MNNLTEVDLHQARVFLKDHFDTTPSTVEYTGQGAWSRCFGFQLGGKDLVIRFGKQVDDFQKDKLARAYDSPGLPVPEVLEIGQAFDGYYAVSTRVRGIPLEELDSAGWIATVPAVVSALEALRLTDISSKPGFGVWGPEGGAAHENWPEYLLRVAEDTPEKRTHGWQERLDGHAQGKAAFA